ncbi:MAG: hypothetical protein QNJ97_09610 [Myxococcota bacterium]|nr:hypothetical protein [Myxococcota bacterium]
MRRTITNNRGAVMVMATFVAMLMVGLLYHVSGVGGAALERHLLQDAADAAVFSAATVNARGMNILAFLNLLMVAVLTILVALRLVQALLLILLAALTVLSFVPGGQAAGAAISPVKALHNSIKKVAKQYQKAAKKIVKGLTVISTGVNDGVPVIAMGEGVIISKSDPYNKVSNGGLTWPIFNGLPTKKGTYEELCRRAGENVFAPIVWILPDKAGQFVEKAIGEPIGNLTEKFTAYFCGGNSSNASEGHPEEDPVQKEVAYPPGMNTEENEHEGMSKCTNKIPSKSDGKCDYEECEECARMGCKFCIQKMRSTSPGYMRGRWTIVRNDWVEWRTAQGELVKVIARDTTPNRWSMKEKVKGNPCNSDDNPNPNIYDTTSCAGYISNWEWQNPTGTNGQDRVPEKNEYTPKPICERQKREPVTNPMEIDYYLDAYESQSGATPHEGPPPQMTLVQQTLYVVLSGCTIREEIQIEADGEPIASEEDKKKMYPRVLDLERFPDEAEMMSILFGTGKSGRREKAVGIASEKKPTGDDTVTRFSFAAAEYYSQNSDEEAMWHMQWLSRLIRFTWDDGDDTGEGEAGEIGSNNDDANQHYQTAMQAIKDKLGKGVDINDYLLH